MLKEPQAPDDALTALAGAICSACNRHPALEQAKTKPDFWQKCLDAAGELLRLDPPQKWLPGCTVSWGDIVPGFLAWWQAEKPIGNSAGDTPWPSQVASYITRRDCIAWCLNWLQNQEPDDASDAVASPPLASHLPPPAPVPAPAADLLERLRALYDASPPIRHALSQCQAVSLTNDTLTLRARSPGAAELIAQRLARRLAESLAGLAGQPLTLTVLSP